MKTKLKLNDLKITSFVTELNTKEKKTVNAGDGKSSPLACFYSFDYGGRECKIALSLDFDDENCGKNTFLEPKDPKITIDQTDVSIYMPCM